MFTWVPDGDGDNPPEQVLVMETCTASWSGYATSAPTGTCTNGLGFDEVDTSNSGPYPDSIQCSGQSSGTRYTVVPGQQTVTLTCSPSANMSDSGDAFASASVNYSATAAPLDIIFSGGIVTNFTQRYLIGQQVTATLDSAGLLIDPNTEQWSASGGAPFLNYVVAQDASSATYTPMSTQTTSTFVFYFAKPGQGTVTCTATLLVPAGSLPIGGINITVHKQCQVDPPTFTPAPVLGSTHIEHDANGNQLLALAIVPDPAGMRWTGHVTTPSEYTNQYGAGTWGIAQIRTPERTVVYNGQSLHWSINGTTGLDSGFLYQGHSYIDNGSQQTDYDSPATELVPLMTSATAADSFATYVMYQPPGPGSVYVPLRYWTWSWIGATSRPTINDLWGDPTDESVLGAPGDYPPHPTWTTQIDRSKATLVP